MTINTARSPAGEKPKSSSKGFASSGQTGRLSLDAMGWMARANRMRWEDAGDSTNDRSGDCR